jgi:hypothetical protein
MFLDKSTGVMGGRSIQIHTFYPKSAPKIAEVKMITSFQIQDGFQNKQLLPPKITVLIDL